MIPSDDAATHLDGEGLDLERTRDGLVVPDYDGYCFANVPGTVADVLGVDLERSPPPHAGQPLPSDAGRSSPTDVGQSHPTSAGRALPADVLSGVETDVSHVVVVVLDSLGWRRWHRDRDDHRFLARLTDRGTVSPLTSVVPSSTASAITSVHTGATPAEHGVLGMHAYVPEADDVVHTFRQAIRADAPDAGADVPVPASDVVDSPPVYPAFDAAGVDAHVVQPAATLGTDYADAVFRGARQVPTGGPTETARAVRRVLESAEGRTYTYAYVSALDEASHPYGSDSAAYHDALANVTSALSRELYDRLDPAVADETLLLVTADHGMVDLEPGPAGCLDVLDVDGLRDSLRWSGDRRVRPYGDPRVCHVAVEPGREEAVVAAAERDGAIAFTRKAVRDLGLFGPDPGPAFDRRCGDVVLTDAERKLVRHHGDKIVPYVGMHGGLTPGEQLVPFAAARLSRLQ